MCWIFASVVQLMGKVSDMQHADKFFVTIASTCFKLDNELIIFYILFGWVYGNLTNKLIEE